MTSNTKRSRTSAVAAPQSLDEARDFMAEIGDLTRDSELAKLVLSEQVSDLKNRNANYLAPSNERLKALKAGLQAWAEANRAELTKKSKTVDLGAGVIRWRKRPPSVNLRGIDDIIKSLKKLDLMPFIRTKEEVNKEALLADPETAASIAGVTIRSAGEDFVIEPAERPGGEKTQGSK